MRTVYAIRMEPYECPLCDGIGEIEVSWNVGKAPWQTEEATIKCPACIGSGTVSGVVGRMAELAELRNSNPYKASVMAAEIAYDMLERTP